VELHHIINFLIETSNL